MSVAYYRFMVFCSDEYESQGGLGDCFNSFNDKDEAIKFALKQKKSRDKVEIFDRLEGIIIPFN